MKRAPAHLKLIVDNEKTGVRDDLFSEYCRAKRLWDASRHSGRPNDNLRRQAFAALKAWDSETAASFGDGQLWGVA